jgi:hypothetical protein
MEWDGIGWDGDRMGWNEDKDGMGCSWMRQSWGEDGMRLE